MTHVDTRIVFIAERHIHTHPLVTHLSPVKLERLYRRRGAKFCNLWTAQAYICANNRLMPLLRRVQRWRKIVFCAVFAPFVFFVGFHIFFPNLKIAESEFPVQSHSVNYQLSPRPPSSRCNTLHEIPYRCPSFRSGNRPCLRRAYTGLQRAPIRQFHAVS